MEVHSYKFLVCFMGFAILNYFLVLPALNQNGIHQVQGIASVKPVEQIVGCFPSATSTSSVQILNLNSSMLTYENSPFGFRIQCIPGMIIDDAVDDFTKWQRIEIYSYFDIARLSFPDYTNSHIIITVGRVGDQSLADYSVEHTDFYGGTRENFQLLYSGTNDTLAGRDAYRIVYTDVENDTALKWLEVGTIVNDTIYYIQYSALPEDFQYNLENVQRMINSFEIFSIDEVPVTNNDYENHTFSDYKSENYGIQVSYPSTWKTSELLTDIPGLTNVVKFESPSYAPYNENVIIARDNVHKDEDVYEYVAKRIQDYRHDPNYVAFTIIEVNRQYNKLLESPGYQIIYAYQNPNGGTDTVLGSESGTIVDDHAYQLIYLAHFSRYSTFLDLATKMIDSFRIFIDSLTPDLSTRSPSRNPEI